MSGHTPGPWRVASEPSDNDIIAADGTHVVCFGHDYDDYGCICARSSLLREDSEHERYSKEWYAEYTRETEANAALIAAAPDLYAALRVFTDRYVAIVNSGDCGNWDPESDAEVIAARAALAKADGRG